MFLSDKDNWFTVKSVKLIFQIQLIMTNGLWNLGFKTQFTSLQNCRMFVSIQYVVSSHNNNWFGCRYIWIRKWRFLATGLFIRNLSCSELWIYDNLHYTKITFVMFLSWSKLFFAVQFVYPQHLSATYVFQLHTVFKVWSFGLDLSCCV